MKTGKGELMDALNAIRSILQASPVLTDQIAWDGWRVEQEAMAEKVTRSRAYADGDHAMKLTPEMAAMLRLDPKHEGAPFAVNHCGNIVATPVDRLEVTSIDSPNPAGSVWVKDILDANRFDSLQIDISEATVEDGNTFLLVEYDNDSGEVLMTHEQAYDGIEGVIVIYGANKRKPAAAIKVWQETLSEGGKVSNITRINVYWPDRVEKYIANGEAISKYQAKDKPWPELWMMDNKPIGVPIIHYRNDGKRYNAYGVSILEDVIPIQDILNRTLMSMTMTAELTAFPIRYAIGFKPPSAVTPGMFLYVAPAATDPTTGKPVVPTAEQVALYNAIKIGSLPQGDLSQYLGQAQFLIDQMYMVSRIPMTKRDSANSSGEALKQLEAGLLGRLRRLHVSLGNSWEDAVTLAHRVQQAFGDAPPEIGRVKTQWKPAEIRNDVEVIDNALKLADRVDERTFLEEVAKVYNWDADKIDLILKSKRGDSAARLASLGGGIPGMGGGAFDNQDTLDLSQDLAITESQPNGNR